MNHIRDGEMGLGFGQASAYYFIFTASGRGGNGWFFHSRPCDADKHIYFLSPRPKDSDGLTEPKGGGRCWPILRDL